MRQLLLAATAAAALLLPVHAEEAAPAPSPGEIVEAAAAGEWVRIAPSDLLVMDLAPDAAGKPRRVIIQLMPPPFSQGWIGNIRKLAAAHWWDGTAVTRVQDNYVAQWGDPDGEDAAKAKPLPDGLAMVPESEYRTQWIELKYDKSMKPLLEKWSEGGSAETGPRSADVGPDNYAAAYLFDRGWPLATDEDYEWPVHCYGMVGVGRNLSPDTGSGAELYAVIGHAPRHLDRNIALIGRVVSGIEHLSSLPRGTGPLGFYADPAQRVPIASVRLASDLPEVGRPAFEYLSTESDSFARYADARANRRDPFFIRPAGGADICNIPVPVRAVGAK
ncbi:peptidylprolyl isomerase [Sphingopyxis indica]|uniref:peptidylprolyl isomerase n=1 Tax=Sphingopyxis indica TaxID=436663 RepID=UPI000B7734CA|nr:peptidylprolyl isomerase [Sphingopyxis indica]